MPLDGDLYNTLALAQARAGQADQSIDTLRLGLQQVPNNPEQLEPLLILAQIHHLQGRNEEAWSQFERSGLRAMQQASSSGFKGNVFFKLEQRWGAVTPVVAASPAGVLRTPAFVVGFPRSGTTLLDQFLSGHPAIKTMEEQPFLNQLVTRRTRGEKLLPDQLHQLTGADCDALQSRYWDAASQLPKGADQNKLDILQPRCVLMTRSDGP